MRTTTILSVAAAMCFFSVSALCAQPLIPWPPFRRGRSASSSASRRAGSRNHRAHPRGQAHRILGQQAVVDNRPGAGGTIGTKTSRTRRPTATRCFSCRPLCSDPAVDLREAPVRSAQRPRRNHRRRCAPYMLVVPISLGVKSVQELIALAKTKPGQLNFARRVRQRTRISRRSFSRRARRSTSFTSLTRHTRSGHRHDGRPCAVLHDAAFDARRAVKEGKLRALAVTGKDARRLSRYARRSRRRACPGFTGKRGPACFRAARTPRPSSTS